jgi:cell division protein FtsN
MAGGRGRQRATGAPSARQWVAFGLAGLVILGLTFTLGMLAGRQWARHTPAATAAAPTQKAAAPRRSGLTETRVERAPQIQEKLTFYQTLTAPLGALPLSEKVDTPAKPSPVPRVRPSPDRAPERGADVTLPRKASAEPQATPRTAPRQTAAEQRVPEADQDSPVAGSNGVRPSPGEDRGDAGSEWTVQVGVFSTVQQAAGVKKQLAAKGFDAQVTPVSSSEGQVRYRVRVGAFKTKDEAMRTADRVRSERSVTTYVTAAK